jgi:type I restriction enzyme, S subunit
VKAIFTQKRLPEAWRSVPLGSVVDFIGGSQPPKETFRTEPYEGGVRLVQIRDFRTDKFPTYIPQSLARRHFEESDVMIGRYGPPVFQILRGLSGSYNVALMKAAPKPDLTKDYLFHLLQEPGLHQHVVANSERTAGQSGVNLTLLEAIEIPLPPLAEQRRIAEVLDRAEALRAKRRAALAQLDSLTQSLFLDLFGDPRANERHWELHRIESFVSDMRGGAALEPDDFVDSGFPILHKGAIKANGIIGIDAKKKTFATPAYAAACPKNIVNREFVAVTLRDLVPAGPSIGFTADLRNGPFDEYLLAQGAYGFRVNRKSVLPEYLVHLSNNENFRHVLRQNAVGSTQIHIRTPVYLAIRVPLPPIALQQEFARRVGAVEKLKQAQRAALAEQDALFATLQHRAFRGEL